MIEVFKIIWTRLLPLCLSGPALTGLAVLWLVGVWILTLFATTKRLRAAPSQADRVNQILLFVFAPMLLPLAILVVGLAQAMLPALLVFAVALIPVLAVAATASLLIDYFPEFIRYLIAQIGKLGEFILRFIQNAPLRLVEKFKENWWRFVTLLEVTLARFPGSRMLTRRSAALHL
jgi:hypothetical protein